MNRNRFSIALIAAGSVMMLVALALIAVSWEEIRGSDGNSGLETVAGFGSISTPTPGPSPTPAVNFPPPSEAPIARIVIPGAEIDAPVVVRGVDAQGVMEAPDNATDVAWYDFSAHPGYGGNAVFAAHVDYVSVGPAVFWNLKDLEPGDIIEVTLNDGITYKYAVNFKQQYDAATAPVEEIVGTTPAETVTLITCGGTFNSATHQYDKRLVVRAERVIGDPASLPPGA